MDKNVELAKLILENPELKVTIFYPEETSDNYYTAGRIVKVVKDEFYFDGERYWLKKTMGMK